MPERAVDARARAAGRGEGARHARGTAHRSGHVGVVTRRARRARDGARARCGRADRTVATRDRAERVAERPGHACLTTRRPERVGVAAHRARRARGRARRPRERSGRTVGARVRACGGVGAGVACDRRADAGRAERAGGARDAARAWIVLTRRARAGVGSGRVEGARQRERENEGGDEVPEVRAAHRRMISRPREAASGSCSRDIEPA